MTIGENIRAYRKRAGYSQEKLGQIMGMTQQQIGQYETGVRNPKMRTIRMFATALDVSVSALAPPEIYMSNEEAQYAVIDEIDRLLPPGYTLRGDDAEGDLWLEYPDKTCSRDLSLSEIQDAIEKAQNYLRFELERLRGDEI